MKLLKKTIYFLIVLMLLASMTSCTAKKQPVVNIYEANADQHDENESNENQPNEAPKDDFDLIIDKVNEIKSKKDRYDQKILTLSEASDGVELTGYYDKEILRSCEYREYKMIQQIYRDYIIIDDTTLYIMNKNYSYPEPYDVENATIEAKEYISKGDKLYQLINGEYSKIEDQLDFNEEIIRYSELLREKTEKEKRLLAESKKYKSIDYMGLTFEEIKLIFGKEYEIFSKNRDYIRYDKVPYYFSFSDVEDDLEEKVEVIYIDVGGEAVDGVVVGMQKEEIEKLWGGYDFQGIDEETGELFQIYTRVDYEFYVTYNKDTKRSINMLLFNP